MPYFGLTSTRLMRAILHDTNTAPSEMKLRIPLTLGLGLISLSTASVCGNSTNRRLTFLEAVGKQRAQPPLPVKGEHAYKDNDRSDKKGKLHQAFVDGGSGIHNIVGGVVAEEGRYPYMALLNMGTLDDGSLYYPYCGGTLIAKDAVLTAAHCAFWIDYVAIGGHNWKQSWKGENIKMKEIFVHPEYDYWSNKNDFAVVILENATSLNMVFPLFNSDDMYPSVETISRVMGWGDKSDGGKQSANLREVDIAIISNEDCDECYGSFGAIKSDMICAYNDGGGQDSCQGDSGGPLIIPGADSSEDIQIGIVSWGIGCALEGYPGVYARLSSGFNWVKRTVCEESSFPQTDFCEASYAPTPTSTDFPTITGCEIKSAGKAYFVEKVAPYRHEVAHDFTEGSGVHPIVGGTEAQPGRYPYIVRLNNGNEKDELIEPYCGGVLVSNDTVLTAAHCVQYYYLDYVAIGGHTMDSWEGENIRMKSIIIHPDYDYWTLENDFALVLLESVTSLSIDFPIINSDQSYPSVDDVSRVIGWGLTSYGGFQSNVLMETDLPIISNEDCDQCQSNGTGWVTSDMICGFDPGHGACNGDSGGPLIIPGKDNEKDVLIGLVSWGIVCARYPTVFARVSSKFNWIKKVICEESAAPPTDFCEASYAPTPTPPTHSPTTSLSPTFGPVEGFSFVGEGYCTDSNGESYAGFFRYFYSNGDNECISWCAGVPHPDLVGAVVDHYGPSEYYCFCHFSNGLPDDINVTDYDPNAYGSYEMSHPGFGPILGASNYSGALCYKYDNFTISFPVSAVSIELGTGENINMYSLEVLDTSGNDVALNKPSSQSSTLKTFAASLSVDGDDSTFSHTDIKSQQDDSTAWWKVDLQQESRVSAVTIKNRWCKNKPACLCRLSNASISLLDDFGGVIATQNTGDTCGRNDLSYTDFYPFFSEATDWPTWTPSYNDTDPTFFPTKMPTDSPIASKAAKGTKSAKRV